MAGSLIWSATTDNSDGSSADVRLQGEQGFTFEGFTGNGVFGPSQCISPECGTGSVVDLLARWGGGDLEGIATLKGQTYTDLGSASGFEGMLAEWTGQLTIPSGFAGGTLAAPFLFSGVFSYGSGASGEASQVGLRGSGTTTLSFRPYPDQPGAFLLESARYDFSAAPTPEPSTMMLVGLGAAAIARARSRRNREDTEREC